MFTPSVTGRVDYMDAERRSELFRAIHGGSYNFFFYQMQEDDSHTGSGKSLSLSLRHTQTILHFYPLDRFRSKEESPSSNTER